MPLYLDYNATAPVDPRVLDEMIRVYRDDFGNAGSRTHRFGQRASQIVENARKQVANLVGVDKSEVVFTSGATESDNLAILGLAKWGAENNRRHIISSNIEHKAILEPLAYLQQQGFEVELVPAHADGRVDAEEVLRRLRPDTLLVSIMHANNETGMIQLVHEIGQHLAVTPTYFHVDAAQTCGKLVPELRNLQYDLLSMSGHKMYGPQGVGALITRRRSFRRPPVQPLLHGGGQESGLRPGTVPVALVAGLGTAAEIAAAEHPAWKSHCLAVKEAMLQQLADVQFQINGDIRHQLAHCINVSFSNVDSEALMMAAAGDIAVSNGSACTSADYKPSHVLKAMGFDATRIESAVRISWGPSTPLTVDIRPVVELIKQLG